MNKTEFQQLTEDKKLEEIYGSVEKMRKYFMWTLILSLVFFVLPLIAMIFVIPRFLSSLDYSSLGL